VTARVRDVRQYLRLVSACDVLVAGDTGPVHMATALDVPTVTIFGPIDPTAWSARIPITAVIRGDWEA
jgi:3-deoxy-D-manno-octulosonic-acid transferase